MSVGLAARARPGCCNWLAGLLIVGVFGRRRPGIPPVAVPFAMEDGGTLGAHALALLNQLAEFAVSRGCFCSPDSRAPITAPMQVSLWMQRWQHRLSTWLHVTLSQQLLRMYHPEGALSAVLS